MARARFIDCEGPSYRVVDTKRRRDVVTVPGGRSVGAERTAKALAGMLNRHADEFDQAVEPAGDDG